MSGSWGASSGLEACHVGRPGSPPVRRATSIDLNAQQVPRGVIGTQCGERGKCRNRARHRATPIPGGRRDALHRLVVRWLEDRSEVGVLQGHFTVPSISADRASQPAANRKSGTRCRCRAGRGKRTRAVRPGWPGRAVLARGWPASPRTRGVPRAAGFLMVTVGAHRVPAGDPRKRHICTPPVVKNAYPVSAVAPRRIGMASSRAMIAIPFASE